MIGEFEFGLDVVVLVLQDLSLLSYTLGLNFVFLSADFIVYTILLHRQCMDMCHQFIVLPVLCFHLLFKLQLSIEQLVV